MLNIKQAVSSSYHNQSNGQVEACLKFMKCTMNGDQLYIYLAS